MERNFAEALSFFQTLPVGSVMKALSFSYFLPVKRENKRNMSKDLSFQHLLPVGEPMNQQFFNPAFAQKSMPVREIMKATFMETFSAPFTSYGTFVPDLMPVGKFMKRNNRFFRTHEHLPDHELVDGISTTFSISV
jgi:hypothetical protein